MVTERLGARHSAALAASPAPDGTPPPASGGSPGTDRAAWRRELARAFRDTTALLSALGLTPEQVPDLDPRPAPFRLLVPRGLVGLMTPGDPRDPLLRQVLPLGAERAPADGDALDPVGDGPAARAPGLLQKYRGRVLLLAQGACAVHCRYCFRRHYPYGELAADGGRRAGLRSALAAIAGDPSIHEVILSGGDPLMLDDAPLGDLIERLSGFAHLRRLRLHTRLPVVLPERVTDALCGHLQGTRLRPVVVIHANHAREIGQAAADGLARLRAAGVVLLNQSVLLAGVNDDADILADLSERLFETGTLPYYLHALDPVQGAAHFRVPDRRARGLIRSLRERLPGYLVPRLVREVPGGASKRPLA